MLDTSTLLCKYYTKMGIYVVFKYYSCFIMHVRIGIHVGGKIDRTKKMRG
jgi:hypothetical protein